MSYPLVKYVLMGAVRDKLVTTLLILLLLGCSLSFFLGSSAVIEKDRFALVFAAGGLRLVGMMGLVLFVVFFVRRSFDGKDVEFLLSRPVSRVAFLYSYAFAFSVLALILGLAVGVCLYAVGPHLFGEGHLLWIASIIVENVIMVNVALFFSMYMSSATSAAMSSFAFYVLGRMMGQLLGIIDSSLVVDTGPMAMAVQFVSVVTPRLDLLGQTSWLIYGVGEGVGIGFVTLQGALFCLLISLAALLDFLKRQF
ncbi:MAG: hypothetical protein KDI90_04585 [Alphaproteobacteria bacterium]|nr:hypothetical protein [Alphaproteobacteria bacterium]MCB9974850.1 hypothetical protein [Rhodospirillales bacterium]